VRKGKSAGLQGTLDLLILKSLENTPMHGYGIACHIERISGELLIVEEGSLYPALHRVEHLGWIRSQWGPSESGRRAKFYQLTRAGRRQLRMEEERWQKLTKGVGKVLRYA
jgi:PadR family transcriptional regulator PadR